MTRLFTVRKKNCRIGDTIFIPSPFPAQQLAHHQFPKLLGFPPSPPPENKIERLPLDLTER